jgi:hypothetical protein
MGACSTLLFVLQGEVSVWRHGQCPRRCADSSAQLSSAFARMQECPEMLQRSREPVAAVLHSASHGHHLWGVWLLIAQPASSKGAQLRLLCSRGVLFAVSCDSTAAGRTAGMPIADSSASWQPQPQRSSIDKQRSSGQCNCDWFCTHATVVQLLGCPADRQLC